MARWLLLPPTAVQVLAEVHETAFSTLWRGGKAVCRTVQVLPFHRSASVRAVGELTYRQAPAAVQLAADVHDAASGMLTFEPGGLAGVGFDGPGAAVPVLSQRVGVSP